MLNHIEPYWTMLNHVKPCWNILNHIRTMLNLFYVPLCSSKGLSIWSALPTLQPNDNVAPFAQKGSCHSRSKEPNQTFGTHIRVGIKTIFYGDSNGCSNCQTINNGLNSVHSSIQSTSMSDLNHQGLNFMFTHQPCLLKKKTMGS